MYPRIIVQALVLASVCSISVAQTVTLWNLPAPEVVYPDDIPVYNLKVLGVGNDGATTVDEQFIVSRRVLRESGRTVTTAFPVTTGHATVVLKDNEMHYSEQATLNGYPAAVVIDCQHSGDSGSCVDVFRIESFTTVTSSWTGKTFQLATVTAALSGPTNDPSESNTPDQGASKKFPVAAVVGGAVGGLVALSVIIALFVFCRRKRRSVPQPMSSQFQQSPSQPMAGQFQQSPSQPLSGQFQQSATRPMSGHFQQSASPSFTSTPFAPVNVNTPPTHAPAMRFPSYNASTPMTHTTPPNAPAPHPSSYAPEPMTFSTPTHTPAAHFPSPNISTPVTPVSPTHASAMHVPSSNASAPALSDNTSTTSPSISSSSAAVGGSKLHAYSGLTTDQSAYIHSLYNSNAPPEAVANLMQQMLEQNAAGKTSPVIYNQPPSELAIDLKRQQELPPAYQSINQ